jgi:hypothetical protein
MSRGACSSHDDLRHIKGNQVENLAFSDESNFWLYRGSSKLAADIWLLVLYNAIAVEHMASCNTDKLLACFQETDCAIAINAVLASRVGAVPPERNTR